MKYYNEEKDIEVEIPSLQTSDELGEEEYCRVDNMKDMQILVQCMGFDSIEDFDEQCERPAASLVGKFFLIMGKAHGKLAKQPVYVKEAA